MKRYILKLTFVLASFSLFGQVGVGSWREHLPYRNSLQLEMAENQLFCLTESGLFSYSFNDNRIETYTKITGLSDVGISSLAFDEVNSRLLIAYQNGNVDVLENNQLTNIPDIKSANLPGSSAVHCILFEGDKALLATGFGVVELNLDKAEVADTYYIGPGGNALQVNSLDSDTRFFWAATQQGIFRADKETANLADYNNWTQLDNLSQYQRNCKYVLSDNDQVFVVRSVDAIRDEVLVYKNGEWKELISEISPVTSFRIQEGRLWIAAGGQLHIYNTMGQEQETVQQVGAQILNVRDGLQAGDGNRYFADFGRGLLQLQGENLHAIRPDGPQYPEVCAMRYGADALYVVRGGVDENFQGKEYPGEIGRFANEHWEEITSREVPDLNGAHDFVRLMENPLNSAQMFVGSWGQGLYLLEDAKLIEHWDARNSPLGSSEARIAGLDTDEEGNLWILDAGTSSPVKVMTRDGEWITLPYGPLANQIELRKIIVTPDGDKWIMTGPGKPLFAVNENHTLANPDDDVLRSFSVRDENQNLLTSHVHDMVADKDGSVWLGTNKGVMVYAQPGNLLRNENFYAYRPVITIDGNSQYLLGTEQVNCIAVDGANQKWLGTKNSGVFLVSSGGDEQIYHFHTGNSPLLSDQVNRISVDPRTGEVFFSTEKGLVSYKGKVTEGDSNFSQLYVYPNPVRETYSGDIVVTGLMTDSSVKITDVGGNLVFEGKSQGGQMIWDGRNFSGSRVHTGVYLIFCASSDGSKSKVIKLLFVN